MNAFLIAMCRGAAAGAAGTTMLNVVTYADMVLRARPASDTPTATVEALEARLGLRLPGSDNERRNRVPAVGALMGIVAGVGTGALLGAVREAGVPPGRLLGTLLASAGALAGTNGPMIVLDVTDPRAWTPRDWVSDLVPHIAYGMVTAAVLDGLERSAREGGRP